MEMSASCPSSQELRQLLEERLSGERYTECLQHLDTCTGCQESLEELATGQPHWSTIVAHVDRDRPAANSAYWPALRRVESVLGESLDLEPTDSGPVAIDFLETSTDPGYLGSLAHFDIVRILGRGGMGVVMEALDRCLQRRVAIKVLDPRLAENEVARQRFCREARAAAAITHENVVALYQVEKSEESGIAFLVMQLVDGETLEQRLIRQRRLPVADVVRIGMQVAAGLAAAHARGLIHRDIKPGNILLERPFDRVKLTDFGLVRATEDVRLTQTGFVTGTPLYMAPEQALGDEIDERTDLFSLGAVLYELCTGRTPFAGRTPLAVLKSITDTSPEPIQDLNAEVPDWLARLIERLLAKRPEDRFASAADVAEVLASHYSQLHPLSPLELPGIARSSGAVPMNLSGPTTRLATFVRGRIAFFCAGLLAIAGVAWFTFDRDEAGATARPVAVFSGNSGPVWSMAFSPDGETLLTGIDDGTVRLWDVPGRRVRSTVHAHRGPAWAVAVSAEGDLFATGTDDGSVKIWDAETGEELCTLQTEHPVRALSFAPQGANLAIGCRTGNVEIWDAATGERQLATAGHSGVVVSIAYSPDGTMLGTASGDKSAKLWDAQTGAELVSLSGHNGGVYGIAFTGNNRQVVTGGWDRTVRLWDVTNGNALATLTGHKADVWAVASSPTQPIAVSVGEDRTVRVWDLAERSSLAILTGHEGTLYTAAFARDGTHIASAGRDGTVRLWSIDEIAPRAEVAD